MNPNPWQVGKSRRHERAGWNMTSLRWVGGTSRGYHLTSCTQLSVIPDSCVDWLFFGFKWDCSFGLQKSAFMCTPTVLFKIHLLPRMVHLVHYSKSSSKKVGPMVQQPSLLFLNHYDCFSRWKIQYEGTLTVKILTGLQNHWTYWEFVGLCGTVGETSTPKYHHELPSRQ